jgi:hypothetical protein
MMSSDEVVHHPNKPINLHSSCCHSGKHEALLESSSVVFPQLFEIRTDPTKGRGLFARQYLEENSLVHIAPCISISKEEYENHMKFTCLEHYLFNCRATGDKYLALGYGSLFNHHSTHPNVIYKVFPKEREIRFYVGYKPIQRDEELCISYGNSLWFQDANNSASTADRVDNDESDYSSSSSSSTGLSFLSRMAV